MERWQVVTAVVAGYLLITLAIGLVGGRRTTHGVAGYVAADRHFGLLPMFFVVGGTVFSAFAFLGGPGWAYSRGVAVLYILSYGVIGMAPWYFLGPKTAAIGRRFGYVTQAQLVTGRFPSRPLSALFALLTIGAFVPYIMLQMSGAGIVFAAVTDGHVPHWLGAALAYGVVTTYVLVGGVAAVGWTNVFEGIVMMCVAWLLGIYIPHALYGGIGPMFEQIAAARPELLELPGLAADGQRWSWGAYSSTILSSAIGIAIWPHIFMKAFTAKSDATMRRTVVLFPIFQLFLVPLILVGFAGVLFATAPETPDFVLPHMILNTGHACARGRPLLRRRARGLHVHGRCAAARRRIRRDRGRHRAIRAHRRPAAPLPHAGARADDRRHCLLARGHPAALARLAARIRVRHHRPARTARVCRTLLAARDDARRARRPDRRQRDVRVLLPESGAAALRDP
jgi:SSS family solute:Na+ symporter